MNNTEIDYNLLEVEKGNRRYGIYLKNHIQDLQEKNRRLNNIINKAIEYIEKNTYTTFETQDDINYYIVRLDTCEDLLDILKGVDKDEN